MAAVGCVRLICGSRGGFFGCDLRDGCKGVVDSGTVHIAVGHHAHEIFLRGRAQDSLDGELLANFRRRCGSFRARRRFTMLVDHSRRIEGDSFYGGEALCQVLRVFVIEMQALGDSSRAINPAAASTPAWRIPPPSIFL